jgi:hypothetical protein
LNVTLSVSLSRIAITYLVKDNKSKSLGILNMKSMKTVSKGRKSHT